MQMKDYVARLGIFEDRRAWEPQSRQNQETPKGEIDNCILLKLLNTFLYYRSTIYQVVIMVQPHVSYRYYSLSRHPAHFN